MAQAPHNPFQYIRISEKRQAMRQLLQYARTAMENLKEELVSNYPPADRMTEDELASIWFHHYIEEYLMGDVGSELDDHWQNYIQRFGLRDALNIMPETDRDRPDLWNVFKAIIRECWECRLKLLAGDRRKKIKAPTPALREIAGIAEEEQ